MSFWKMLIKGIKYKAPVTKGIPQEMKLGENVYGIKGDVKQFNIFMRMYHKIVKYTIIIPTLELLKWVLRKHMLPKKDVPEHKVMNVIDDTYEKTIRVWSDLFLRNVEGRKEWDQKTFMKGGCAKRLREIKSVMLTIAKYDTAYLEFVNVFAHEFTKAMMKENPDHIFYNSGNIHDPKYYIVQKAVSEGLIIREVVKETKK